MGYGNLIDRKEFIPLIDILSVNHLFMRRAGFYWSVWENVTPGRVRTAFKRLGFYGMVE